MSDKEKEVIFTYYLAPVFLIFAFILFFYIKFYFDGKRQPEKVSIIRVEGNVRTPKTCIFYGKIDKEKILECGNNMVVSTPFEIRTLCNGCTYYVPYPEEKLKIRPMHLKILNSLGKKKCLKDVTFRDLISINGIGRRKAVIILNSKDVFPLSKAKGIGPKTVNKLKKYIDLSPACRVF